MNRTEAVSYLRELLNRCNEVALNTVSVEEQKIGNAINYKLHIHGSIREGDKQVARDIAQKFRLQVTDSGEEVVVFTATGTS
jgi:hypothetical protein